MNLGEILGDAIVYPLHNVKSLVLYVILGIIGAIIGGASVISILGALGTTGDIGRQISNTIKLIVVDVVYYVVPAIIVFVLGLFLRDWLMTIISIIIFIVFALANFMAKCRLAKTDSMGEALAIGEAIGDISRVGLLKIIATIIVMLIIAVVAAIIIAWIGNLNNIVGSILLGIFAVYFLFFYNRAIGLLYSDA